MSDIVIPEITIGFWELPMAALIMIAFLISGMVISNKRDWLKKTLWRKEALFWVFGSISIALLIPAIGHIFGLLYLTDITDLTTGDQRGFAIILAAIVGAPFVIWRTWVAQRQADTDEQGLITDRITRAVEQLGAEKTVWESEKQNSKPNLEVRLGGIYALERIVQDSARDCATVLEILCAYVRNNASRYDVEYTTNNSIPRIDIAAILNVLAVQNLGEKFAKSTNRQNKFSGKQKYKLAGAELQYASMGDGNFMHADFAFSNLEGANLLNAVLLNANLWKANLEGSHLNWCNLSGANMIYAKFDSETDFSNANTSLAAVKNVDFSAVTSLNEIQYSQMMGDGSTILPSNINRPQKWPRNALSDDDFLRTWLSAKKEAGLP